MTGPLPLGRRQARADFENAAQAIAELEAVKAERQLRLACEERTQLLDARSVERS